MQQRDILIKWTGSKRFQTDNILRQFPKQIKTYYEPFLGGGSVLYALLSSNIEVEKCECSDINKTLIAIWHFIQDDPQALHGFYEQHWPCDKDKYYKMRSEFNVDRDPRKFFYLLRTCRNGMVRYNSKGQFNTAFHEGRCGITPHHLWLIIQDWHEKLAKVRFSVSDYHEVRSQPGDFIYLDPPYPSKDCLYFGNIDFESLWNWMREQRAGYALSLNDQHVPEDLYEKRYDVPGGFQRLNRLHRTEMFHGLYVKSGDTWTTTGSEKTAVK